MKFDELIIRTISEESTKQLIEELSLIYSDPLCEKCNSRMRVETGIVRHHINARWRCRKASCRSSTGYFKDSMFYNIHFPLSKAIRCVYYYAFNMSYYEIACQLSIDEKTISTFINNFMTKIDSENYNEHLPKLGGSADDIFEVDETHLVTRRDARGRILPGEKYWLIGLISRRTKELRCILTRSRNAQTCISFITSNIVTGSTIMTDKWRGYLGLRRLGYIHNSVNHKIEFVDSNNAEIHTQNIEIRWRYLKEDLPQVNTFDSLKKYVNRYLFKYNFNLKTAEERFHFIINKNQL